MSDSLHKFLFEGGATRGEIVSLQHTWQKIVANHAYPAPVMRLLGELVAASTLLTANLKFNGALIMQIHGDGPVRLLVVECNADLTLRATAKVDPDATIADDASFASLINVRGNGRFAITLDPKDRQPGQQAYQGIVPLEGDTVAAILEGYMLRSEQLDTHLWLAADSEKATGLLLQKLPRQGGGVKADRNNAAIAADVASDAPADAPVSSTSDTTVDAADTAASKATSKAADEADQSESDPEDVAQETWNRAVTLARTLERDELLAVDPNTLMRRLFWEETLRVFEPMPCSFHCSCSRSRVAAMLISLGKTEIDEALAELGTLQVNCDFCNRGYEFDAVDCAQLFATESVADATRPPGRARH